MLKDLLVKERYLLEAAKQNFVTGFYSVGNIPGIAYEHMSDVFGFDNVVDDTLKNVIQSNRDNAQSYYAFQQEKLDEIASEPSFGAIIGPKATKSIIGFTAGAADLMNVATMVGSAMTGGGVALGTSALGAYNLKRTAAKNIVSSAASNIIEDTARIDLLEDRAPTIGEVVTSGVTGGGLAGLSTVGGHYIGKVLQDRRSRRASTPEVPIPTPTPPVVSKPIVNEKLITDVSTSVDLNKLINDSFSDFNTQHDWPTTRATIAQTKTLGLDPKSFDQNMFTINNSLKTSPIQYEPFTNIPGRDLGKGGTVLQRNVDVTKKTILRRKEDTVKQLLEKRNTIKVPEVTDDYKQAVRNIHSIDEGDYKKLGYITEESKVTLSKDVKSIPKTTPNDMLALQKRAKSITTTQIERDLINTQLNLIDKLEKPVTQEAKNITSKIDSVYNKANKGVYKMPMDQTRIIDAVESKNIDVDPREINFLLANYVTEVKKPGWYNWFDPTVKNNKGMSSTLDQFKKNKKTIKGFNKLKTVFTDTQVKNILEAQDNIKKGINVEKNTKKITGIYDKRVNVINTLKEHRDVLNQANTTMGHNNMSKYTDQLQILKNEYSQLDQDSILEYNKQKTVLVDETTQRLNDLYDLERTRDVRVKNAKKLDTANLKRMKADNESIVKQFDEQRQLVVDERKDLFDQAKRLEQPVNFSNMGAELRDRSYFTDELVNSVQTTVERLSKQEQFKLGGGKLGLRQWDGSVDNKSFRPAIATMVHTLEGEISNTRNEYLSLLNVDSKVKVDRASYRRQLYNKGNSNMDITADFITGNVKERPHFWNNAGKDANLIHGIQNEGFTGDLSKQEWFKEKHPNLFDGDELNVDNAIAYMSSQQSSIKFRASLPQNDQVRINTRLIEIAEEAGIDPFADSKAFYQATGVSWGKSASGDLRKPGDWSAGRYEIEQAAWSRFNEAFAKDKMFEAFHDGGGDSFYTKGFRGRLTPETLTTDLVNPDRLDELVTLSKPLWVGTEFENLDGMELALHQYKFMSDVSDTRVDLKDANNSYLVERAYRRRTGQVDKLDVTNEDLPEYRTFKDVMQEYFGDEVGFTELEKGNGQALVNRFKDNGFLRTNIELFDNLMNNNPRDIAMINNFGTSSTPDIKEDISMNMNAIFKDRFTTVSTADQKAINILQNEFSTAFDNQFPSRIGQSTTILGETGERLLNMTARGIMSGSGWGEITANIINAPFRAQEFTTGLSSQVKVTKNALLNSLHDVSSIRSKDKNMRHLHSYIIWDSIRNKNLDEKLGDAANSKLEILLGAKSSRLDSVLMIGQILPESVNANTGQAISSSIIFDEVKNRLEQINPNLRASLKDAGIVTQEHLDAFISYRDSNSTSMPEAGFLNKLGLKVLDTNLAWSDAEKFNVHLPEGSFNPARSLVKLDSYLQNRIGDPKSEMLFAVNDSMNDLISKQQKMFKTYSGAALKKNVDRFLHTIDEDNVRVNAIFKNPIAGESKLLHNAKLPVATLLALSATGYMYATSNEVLQLGRSWDKQKARVKALYSNPFKNNAGNYTWNTAEMNHQPFRMAVEGLGFDLLTLSDSGLNIVDKLVTTFGDAKEKVLSTPDGAFSLQGGQAALLGGLEIGMQLAANRPYQVYKRYAKDTDGVFSDLENWGDSEQYKREIKREYHKILNEIQDADITQQEKEDVAIQGALAINTTNKQLTDHLENEEASINQVKLETLAHSKDNSGYDRVLTTGQKMIYEDVARASEWSDEYKEEHKSIFAAQIYDNSTEEHTLEEVYGWRKDIEENKTTPYGRLAKYKRKMIEQHSNIGTAPIEESKSYFGRVLETSTKETFDDDFKDALQNFESEMNSLGIEVQEHSSEPIHQPQPMPKEETPSLHEQVVQEAKVVGIDHQDFLDVIGYNTRLSFDSNYRSEENYGFGFGESIDLPSDEQIQELMLQLHKSPNKISTSSDIYMNLKHAHLIGTTVADKIAEAFDKSLHHLKNGQPTPIEETPEYVAKQLIPTIEEVEERKPVYATHPTMIESSEPFIEEEVVPVEEPVKEEPTPVITEVKEPTQEEVNTEVEEEKETTSLLDKAKSFVSNLFETDEPTEPDNFDILSNRALVSLFDVIPKDKLLEANVLDLKFKDNEISLQDYADSFSKIVTGEVGNITTLEDGGLRFNKKVLNLLNGTTEEVEETTTTEETSNVEFEPQEALETLVDKIPVESIAQAYHLNTQFREGKISLQGYADNLSMILLGEPNGIDITNDKNFLLSEDIINLPSNKPAVPPVYSQR